ncbi:hypothetical protein [Kitasatospora sp. MBT66]|uniref:hypothetical protein n=1 Tax=Kitasatospora sp. MBT66 TaxID=1444769 RepID=UPI000A66A2BA|nr:hypothetical protein [Kitasatospora sp. MBT66]
MSHRPLPPAVPCALLLALGRAQPTAAGCAPPISLLPISLLPISPVPAPLLPAPLLGPDYESWWANWVW